MNLKIIVKNKILPSLVAIFGGLIIGGLGIIIMAFAVGIPPAEMLNTIWRLFR